MNYSTLEPRVPQNIALSFSRGGFRAASYALGCLSYMEHLKIGEGKLTDLVPLLLAAALLTWLMRYIERLMKLSRCFMSGSKRKYLQMKK